MYSIHSYADTIQYSKIKIDSILKKICFSSIRGCQKMCEGKLNFDFWANIISNAVSGVFGMKTVIVPICVILDRDLQEHVLVFSDALIIHAMKWPIDSCLKCRYTYERDERTHIIANFHRLSYPISVPRVLDQKLWRIQLLISFTIHF